MLVLPTDDNYDNCNLIEISNVNSTEYFDALCTVKALCEF